MSDFDIREQVRAVIDETDLTTPGEIAAKVAESIPSRQIRSVLVEVLTDYVRHELGRSQRSAALGVTRAHVPSAKREAIASMAARWLRQRVVIDQEWKTVGDCNRDDCLALAAERRLHAERNAAAALLWEARADLLSTYRATRLGDLPPEALAEAEGREAA